MPTRSTCRSWQLSAPIDPSVANQFNPQDPLNPQNRFAIAVEDVMAYFELARDNGVKRDEDLAATFRRLAEAVHPLALGNVQRSIAMIQQLAEKLIRLHSEAWTNQGAHQALDDAVLHAQPLHQPRRGC